MLSSSSAESLERRWVSLTSQSLRWGLGITRSPAVPSSGPQTFVSSGFPLFPSLRTLLDSHSLCSSLPWQLRLDKSRLKAVRLLQNWIHFISACTIESCSSPATLSPKNYPPIALFWILLLWSVTLCISTAVVKHSEHIKHRVWILYKGNKVCIYGEPFPQWSPSVKFLIINNMSTNFCFIIDEEWSSALVFFIEFLNVTKCSVMMREEENGKTGRMFPGCRRVEDVAVMWLTGCTRGRDAVWYHTRKHGAARMWAKQHWSIANWFQVRQVSVDLDLLTISIEKRYFCCSWRLFVFMVSGAVWLTSHRAVAPACSFKCVKLAREGWHHQ